MDKPNLFIRIYTWIIKFLSIICCSVDLSEDKGNTKDAHHEINQRSEENSEVKPSQVRAGSNLNQSLNRQNSKPPSLMNIGATCYLNSAFQGISACDQFVNDIDNLCNEYQKGQVMQLEIFKELMDILNGCSKYRMNISRNSIFRNWNKPGQQDSYELLAYALNQVYNEIRAHKEKMKEIPYRDLNQWLLQVLPMRCILTYKIVCDCEMTSYSPLQSDLALHVTIPITQNKWKLKDLIDLYFSEDEIEDFICDRRGCEGKVAKRLARLRLPIPNTICIHLQRTLWNGRRMVKINKDVKFDLVLVVKSKYIDEIETIVPIEVAKENGTSVHSENEDCDSKSETKEDATMIEITSNESGDVEKETETLEHSESGMCVTEPKEDASMNEITPILNTYEDVVNQTKTSVHLESKNRDSKSEAEKDAPMIENSPKESGDVEKDTKSSEHSENENCDSQSESKEEAPMIEIYPFLNAYEDAEKDQIYKLVSVIVHSGNVDGGHYVCYKSVCDKWFITNDSYVREVEMDDVLKSQAYILFYEKFK